MQPINYEFSEEFTSKFKTKEVSLYLDIAQRIANQSYCIRLQVGAVIVRDNNIISFGYNGTIKGAPNQCEFIDDNSNLVTLDTVLHAESNAITKACKSPISTEGATLYCTHSCCIHCAKLIIQSGIEKFIYLHDYRSSEGVDFLKSAGIEVFKIDSNH